MMTKGPQHVTTLKSDEFKSSNASDRAGEEVKGHSGMIPLLCSEFYMA